MTEPTNINHLSKEERINLTWAQPELPEKLYKLLQKDGFKTGSAVYGVEENAKDEDWCIEVPPDVFKDYVVGMTDRGYWEDRHFSALYAHYRGKLINIICFSDSDLYNAWFHATQYMVLMKHQEIQVNPYQEAYLGCPLAESVDDAKWSRVRMFSALVDSLWSVKHLPEDKRISKGEAVQYKVCMLCGRKAINFTCYPELQKYRETGVCERCREIARHAGQHI